jgi:hypothetical protein
VRDVLCVFCPCVWYKIGDVLGEEGSDIRVTCRHENGCE